MNKCETLSQHYRAQDDVYKCCVNMSQNTKGVQFIIY